METIEFTGPPHAGKSTLAKELGHRLYLKDVHNQIIRRGMRMPGSFIHRDNFYDRQLLILAESVIGIIRLRDESKADILFVDQGPWNAVIFFTALAKRQLISKEQAIAGISFAMTNIHRIDFVVLVKIPVEASLQRTYLDLSMPQDLVRDRNFLEAFVQASDEIEKELPEESLIIDGTLPIKQNLEILEEVIISIAKSKNPSLVASQF
ncbi:MAG: hypothetical protein A3A94_02710 [Candidatus Portnoybacteria bacterium RIFCSPLOWO2_01_FULL_43_11]|uniref:NadR/Ttd14 AAA domain-containing protein n=4 Tax=Candidatus Portnoyibacteriota TaxID=1817913 RepID=A0A1G2FBK4_9BACT|nr:MAG: hypothetical protein A2815_01210 [Candidatus Portnoybacteria bacterium RIFCSPHIGHO2_01_FULL_40_12b]OGZ36918.1 MAG: hypothetical protein A3D38_02380 [Candidatus Portnoybacteria bacterium RIFCSPHIGHO2_02_FULL_40_23]OGZ37539.1 MAG: hypothetical protein A3E90_01075 [Candidatus Portnoybacteria bacterium RIFCSPHIGHO2_12_FULL_40_11]OGZ38019.1 MAG: hypothetical protein A3A94_02710 [Candidatus Portnoybacteria bacterium RIFCSPLOWO2_01_FULL_43_11]OGZ39792.1 MAG: hypothetical protein A3I20_00840 [C